MESKKAKDGKRMSTRKNGVIRAKSDFFRTARYGLTLQEHRIIYYAILKGQQDGIPFEPVTISITEFKELCGLKGKAYYGIIREMSKKMSTRVVEAVYKDGDGYHLLQAPWLVGITYHTKNGTVTIEPNKKLQPFFEGKPFTETEYYFLIKFTSQYAERLYELVKSHSYAKPIMDFDIADLRKRLGVGENQYTNYNMLKARVLEPAIKDVNEFTDLDVTLKEKHGRYNKVETVYFAVTKKKVPKLAERVEDGEFKPPLSEQEQELMMKGLLGEDSMQPLLHDSNGELPLPGQTKLEV